jgi:hypothetical protein
MLRAKELVSEKVWESSVLHLLNKKQKDELVYVPFS